MSGDRQVEKDLHSYNTLLNLWQAENPIKTIKLQFLLVTNALLIGFFQVCGTAMPERIADSSLLAIGGFVLYPRARSTHRGTRKLCKERYLAAPR